MTYSVGYHSRGIELLRVLVTRSPEYRSSEITSGPLKFMDTRQLKINTSVKFSPGELEVYKKNKPPKPRSTGGNDNRPSHD
jgi:hypothetical protein